MYEQKIRIGTLDGLRAIAAIGVLWIHCWTAFGNPHYHIMNIDIAKIFAIGGNGVDLFFVVSGFCMYYFYSQKSLFSHKDFLNFLLKRWKRLSPAFYTATLGYIVYNVNDSNSYPYIRATLTSIFYLNNVLDEYNAAGLFWTLGVEWQFYIIIPFILIYQKRIGLKNFLLIISIIFFVISLMLILTLKEQSDLWINSIIFRYFEFQWGIIVASALLNSKFRIHKRILFFILGIIFTILGRVLFTNEILSLSRSYYNIFRLTGYTLLSLGFSVIIYLTLTSTFWLKNFFGNKWLSRLGRISFSFYLWHGLVLVLVAPVIRQNVDGPNLQLALTSFLLSLLILLPVSFVSYKFLEEPFFRPKYLE